VSSLYSHIAPGVPGGFVLEPEEIVLVLVTFVREFDSATFHVRQT
jgi:hypothetical protein